MPRLPKGFQNIKTGMVFERDGEYWKILEFVSLPPRVRCVDFETGAIESIFPLDDDLVGDVDEFGVRLEKKACKNCGKLTTAPNCSRICAIESGDIDVTFGDYYMEKLKSVL